MITTCTTRDDFISGAAWEIRRGKERNVENMRKEHDFIGELEVPDEVYYGVQTMRAIDNFHITGQVIDPDFVQSIARVKKAAAMANMATGRLDKKIGEALIEAADEIIDGKLLDQFPVDPIQGGAGTSINMNMNEVSATAHSRSSASRKAATTSSPRTTMPTWHSPRMTRSRRASRSA